MLSWLGNGVKRLENTVNNDVVKPIARDVVQPVQYAAAPVVQRVQGTVAQVNPLDNGRTYNTVMQRGANYAPQAPASAFQQAARIPLSVGNPFASPQPTLAPGWGVRALAPPPKSFLQRLPGDIKALPGGIYHSVADPASTVYHADIANPVKLAAAEITHNTKALNNVGKSIQTYTPGKVIGAGAQLGSLAVGGGATKAAEAGLTKVVGNAVARKLAVPIAGAAVNAGYNVASIPASGQKLTSKNALKAAESGAKQGAILGVAGEAAPLLIKGLKSIPSTDVIAHNNLVKVDPSYHALNDTAANIAQDISSKRQGGVPEHALQKSVDAYNNILDQMQQIRTANKQIGAVGKNVNKPDPLAALKQEALKYKSADEFVNSKVNAYHGTDKQFDQFDPNKAGSTMGMDKYGTFFTSDPERAKVWSKMYPADKPRYKWTPEDKTRAEKAIVMRAHVDESDPLNLQEVKALYDAGKIKTKPQTEGLFRPESYFDNNRQAIKEAMDVTGKKVFKARAEGQTHYAVADSSKMYSEKQLTDLYNQAHAEAKPNVPEVPNLKPIQDAIKSAKSYKTDASQASVSMQKRLNAAVYEKAAEIHGGPNIIRDANGIVGYRSLDGAIHPDLGTMQAVDKKILESGKVTQPTQGASSRLPETAQSEVSSAPAATSRELSAKAKPQVPEKGLSEKQGQTKSSVSTNYSKKYGDSSLPNNTTFPKNPPDFLAPTKPGKDSIQRGAERITAEDRMVASNLNISPQRARSLRLRPPVPPELNGPVNAKLAGITPKIDEIPQSPKNVGTLPPIKEASAFTKTLSSKVNALRKIGGKSGNELANRMQAIDRNRRNLRANWMYQSKTALNLSDKEFAKAVDVKEGNLSPSKVSPKIQQAVKEMHKVLPDVFNKGKAEGLMVGDRGKTYFPHQYPKAGLGNKAQIDSALQHIMDTNQVDHQTASQLFKKMEENGAGAPNRFGNFENARLTDMPGYFKDKQAYMDYLDHASKRISEAHYFGTDNMIANKLLDNLRMEGGDHATAQKAVENYLHSADKGTGAGALRTARGITGFARLGKASISHVGQTTNTAVEAGVGRTVKAWGQFLSRKPEHRDFIAKTGVINPSELHSYRNQMTSVTGVLSKGTAPLLERDMRINRSVSALAGRAYGDHLAEAGNVSKLRQLGVSGNIGKTLTEKQQIEAARGFVDGTMFSGSRATTPISAETPIGKTVGQYRTAYTYKQTGFIYDKVIKEARNGNLAPLARYLAVSGAVGLGTVAVKNKISGTKQGTGGKLIDTIAGLGGLPGEAAVQLVRYGKKDLTKSVAGLVAPLAGEAVDLGERATQALQGKPQQLERYGLGLIPIVGNRIASKVVPYAPGSYKTQASQGAAQPQAGIYQVKAKDGSTKFATLQSSTLKSFPSLQAAQQAQAKNEFKFSPKQTTTINGQPYHKSASGLIEKGPMTQATNHTYTVDNGMKVQSADVLRVHSENTAKLTSAKQSGDVNGYLSTAQAQLKNISHQLQDPTVSASKAQSLANEAQSLQTNMRRYSTYGGFTKPTGAATVKSIGSIQGARPDYVSNITKSAAKYGVDVNAALAVAAQEGLGGGVGDNGTSYGPFQLHVGGALPQGATQQWAESPAGIDYAMQQIAKVAGGKGGADAIQAIVTGFEKSANQPNEINNALALYNGSNAVLSPNSPKSASILASSGSSSSTGVSKLDSIVKASMGAKYKTPAAPHFTVKTSNLPSGYKQVALKKYSASKTPALHALLKAQRSIG